jgi:spore germination cell wall hydrolase CwlJ-like protein
MQLILGPKILRAFGMALALTLLGSAGSAEDLLASRLGALLGQERQALAVVPSARMAVLTAPPPASSRDIATVPGTIDYSEAYLAALPAASGNSQWECLTQALYFEARGESVRGIFAVGEVILNRVESGRFPSSICGVVNQSGGGGCQFSYVCDGRSDRVHERAAWNEVGKVAQLLIDGAPRALTDGATYFHTRGVSPSWSRRFELTAQIGAHLFYSQPVRTASN